eukprot:4335889-Pleurochrysis_carterae.AAC.1
MYLDARTDAHADASRRESQEGARVCGTKKEHVFAAPRRNTCLRHQEGTRVCGTKKEHVFAAPSPSCRTITAFNFEQRVGNSLQHAA